MRAAPGDPRRGAIPMELVSSQSFGDFPMLIVKTVDMKAGMSRTNRLIRLKMVAGHKHGNILKNSQKAMFLCSADTYLLFR